MRPTRLGWGCLAMAALTLLTAASTGNNLLYLLYSALTGALAVAAIGGRYNLKRARIAAEPPDQVFRGSAFPLTLKVANVGRWPVFGVHLSWQGSAGLVERVDPGQSAPVELRGTLPYRGLNELTDLVCESSFPFGLLRHRREATVTVLALPRARDARAAAEINADVRASGRPTLRKGGGEELYGIREYSPGDDARIINWKLSARTGRPLVNEYCGSHTEKITVTVRGVDGPDADRHIEEAAAACRFHIEAGAEVRLESAQESVDYGRGLLQLGRLLAALARLGEGRRARPSGTPAQIALSVADTPALRRVTMLAATLAYAGMFMIDDINPRLLLAFSPAVALGWAVQERRWNLLPRWLWNALSLAVLAFVLVIDWRVSGVTVANTHLLLYLLLNRMLNPFEPRELPQLLLILLLAFFLVSGLTISLMYFPAFVAFLIVATVWLSLASGLPWSSWRRWGNGAAASLAGVLAVIVGLFMATPRVEGLRKINPFLAAGIDKLSVRESSVTGFTNGVSLGFYGRLRKSSARVMRVKPIFASIPAARMPELRLRGNAFDVFDGSQWSKAPLRGRKWGVRQGPDLVFPAAPASHAPIYDITIYPMNMAVIFTVGTPSRLEDPQAAWFDHTDSIQFPSTYVGGAHYKVTRSQDEGFSRPLAETNAVLGFALKVPAGSDGRVASLAREATIGVGDDFAKVAAIEMFLRQRYDYSDYSDGRDRRLEDFLFKTRKGNCEYFATAAAVMLRHVGVPTRLVTGFLASDWNEYGKFYDVRQAEAHAWVEAYIPGRGWVVMDPTPASNSIRVGAQELVRKVQHWFASVQTEWYRRVIGYDQYVQRNTFHRLGTIFSPQALAGLGKRLAKVAVYAAPFGALAGLMILWRRRKAAFKPALFDRVQAALERAGLTRKKHWTAREFAAWAAACRPELAAATALAELHYMQAYSGVGLSLQESRRAAALFAELNEKLRR